MTVFEIWLNGERACVAGLGGLGVVTAIVTRSKTERQSDDAFGSDGEQLSLDVSGLDEKEGEDVSLKWLSQSLAVGDEIRIKILEAGEISAPIQRQVLPRDYAEQVQRSQEGL